MERECVYIEYTHDREYRFVIYREENCYKTRLQKKLTDGKSACYVDDFDNGHIVESRERAIEIGRERLKKYQDRENATDRTPEGYSQLSGTKIEKLRQAMRLAYTDVSEEELEHFRTVYRENGIILLPTAEEFYRRYGGVFRDHYVILDDPRYNSDLWLCFYADIVSDRWPNEAATRLEDVMDDIDQVKEFAGQEVCPVGNIGFYYPAVVYVGEDGRLYCVYEYQDEIEVFDTPEEIIAEQLSYEPVGIAIRQK